MTKINLGSGDRYIDGWCNVDLWAQRADIREDIRTVEFVPGSVDSVECIHTIEHIDREAGRVLCFRVYEWLKPGGTFVVETPDRAKCLHLIERGDFETDRRKIQRLVGGVGLVGGRPPEIDQRSFHSWIRLNRKMIAAEATEFGHVREQRIPEKFNLPQCFHACVWTEAELAETMQSAGFQVLSRDPKHHGKRAHRDMRLVGMK